MQSFSVQMKTNVATGTNRQLRFALYSADDEEIGTVLLEFAVKVQYLVMNCFSVMRQFPVPEDIPSETEKTWQITVQKKPDVTITIACNGVELLNFVVSKDTCTKDTWASHWDPDVKKIGFPSDSASTEYRAGE